MESKKVFSQYLYSTKSTSFCCLKYKVDQGKSEEQYNGHEDPHADGSSIKVLVISFIGGIPAYVSQPLGNSEVGVCRRYLKEHDGVPCNTSNYIYRPG